MPPEPYEDHEKEISKRIRRWARHFEPDLIWGYDLEFRHRASGWLQAVVTLDTVFGKRLLKIEAHSIDPTKIRISFNDRNFPNPEFNDRYFPVTEAGLWQAIWYADNAKELRYLDD